MFTQTIDSPRISTPNLDQNVDTPFSPFCDTFDLPHYANLNQDLSVENYLNWSYASPTVEFNGNPSELLIDKSKTPQLPACQFDTNNNNNNDGLFPPLPSQPVEVKEDEFQTLVDLGSPLSDFEMEQEPKKTEPPVVVAKEKKKTTKKKIAKKTTQNFSCPHCGHVSKRRYNLGTHIKTHDKNRIKEFGCTECPKRFDRRHDRDRHLATVHHGERSFVCKDCSLHFSRRDGLNRHLAQQHEENDFD
ncbi:hypothetical protein G6F56_007101 [Rhizopus delemar]|nr:hypothetical protein G6F56_007101 [Rhizopus delemar]